jgi:hypothetical protein
MAFRGPVVILVSTQRGFLDEDGEANDEPLHLLRQGTPPL